MTWLDRPLHRRTIPDLAEAFAGGGVTAQALLKEARDAIADPAKPGATTVVARSDATADAAARSADLQRAAGWIASPLAGLPISVKDLFDLSGEITRAGSVLLADRPPAGADATAINRLRQAGGVVVGRTNMTEFAFSGLGLNPHYGTPGNPADRTRIPGGSSSGAGVSVVDGMAAAAIGTDTGGSVRVPAAFTGLAGFKPTQARVPRDGCVPLSYTLDSIGPLAPSVACCAILDAIMAGEPVRPLPPLRPDRLRLAIAEGVTVEDLDDTVARAFARAIDRLTGAGARCEPVALPEFEDIVAANRRGGLVVPEALHVHARWLEDFGDRYDPRIRARIERGRDISVVELVEAMRLRERVRATIGARLAGFDGVVQPTVPIVAPEIARVAADDDVYVRTNALILRNTSIANFLDACAVTIPCQASGELPVGFQILAPSGNDAALLAVGAAVETVIRNPT